MDLYDLLFEFSHKERFKVLKCLYYDGKRHTDLQKELEIPGSEISRHLRRLSEKDLVTKDVNNKYHITNIGKIFIRMMDIFEVSLIHRNFFNSHEITSIPVHLIFQLGKLKNVEFGNKTMENMEIFENLVKNSERFLYAITDQYQKSLLKEVEKKMRDQPLKIKALVDSNLLKSYNIPDGWSKLFKDPKIFFQEMLENIRILDEIKISIIVSDKGAILFLSKDGEIDYSQCLIDNHESFIKWTKEIFKWYWEKGKSLRPFIRKAISSKQ
ncbi:MAG: transcriptional regulator FilR1 domain-containing protein [Promethearchaeota archaeon]